MLTRSALDIAAAAAEADAPSPTPEADAEAIRRAAARRAIRAAGRVSAELDRRSLAHFVRSGWHMLEGATPLEWNWHHDAYCATLQGILTEWLLKKKDPSYRMRARRIVINLCPVSLKTRIMVYAQAWMWLHAPEWKLLYMSGTPKVLDESSTACRDLVSSEWYRRRFGIRWVVREDMNRLLKWGTTAGGQRVSMGFEGNITGVHADCIMCDDPDDSHHVHSEAARRNVKGKWKAAGNRLNDLRVGVLIVVQQRVHPDDLSATCLAQGYTHACWPLEYSAKHRVDVPWYSDPRTTEGEVLHPARFTREVIDAERLRLGSAGFAAQYNQRPEAFEGEMFKRVHLRFFRLPNTEPLQGWQRPEGCGAHPTYVVPAKRSGEPDFDKVVISVDASFGSTSDGASRVSVTAWGLRGADRFALRNTARRRTLKETIAAIGSMWEAYPNARKVLVEKKANGAAVMEILQGSVGSLEGVEPDGGKEVRGAAMQPAWEAGNYYVPEGAEWLVSGEEQDDLGWLDEVCSFPHGRKDDRVDDMTQMANHFADKNRGAWRRVNWG